MFCILLEINDLPLLSKCKPDVIETLRAGFFGMFVDTEASEVSTSTLKIEVEDESAAEISERLFLFFQELQRLRRKLHGFLLALDYAPRGSDFTIQAEGQWSSRVFGTDIFLLTESAESLVVDFLCVENHDDGTRRVVDRYNRKQEITRTPHSSAAPRNARLVESMYSEWNSGTPRSRPLFIHSLQRTEQYRLASIMLRKEESRDSVRVVDLNYPRRFPLGAFVTFFGPNVLSDLYGEVRSENRDDWLKRGKTLLEDENIFCVEDVFSWLGETFSAWARSARSAGTVPGIIILGAEKLDRFCALIVQRLLSPLHQRGELFCMLLASRPIRRRANRYTGIEFKRAPAPGTAVAIGGPDLDVEDREILDIAALFAPFVSCTGLRSRLYKGGYPKHRVDRLFSDLISRGEALCARNYYFSQPEVPYRLERKLYSPKGLVSFFADSTTSVPAPFRGEYAAIAAMLSPGEGTAWYIFLLCALYERSYGIPASAAATVFRLLKSRYGAIARTAARLQERFSGKEPGARARGGTRGTGSDTDPVVESFETLVKIENLLRGQKRNDALSAAKAFLYRVQEEKAPCRIARAQNAVGEAMLGIGRITEANDYFALAYEAGKNCDSSTDRVRSCMNRGTALFLFGNYSRAERMISEGLAAASGLCHGPYLIFAHFVKGRIAFLFGRYETAEEEFLQALTFADVLDEPCQLFYAWIARVKIYAGRIDEGAALLEMLPRSAEVLSYRAEASYFGADYAAALEYSRRAERKIKTEHYLAGGAGGYLWNTGYQNLEDCAFHGESGRGVLLNCITSFRWFMESRFKRGQTGREILERITRTEKLGEFDPFLHFYFLVHSLLIAEDTHNEALERITYLSKGLKYLQRIGSVIDDVPSRLDFLNKNRWNKYLMDLARKEKLA